MNDAPVDVGEAQHRMALRVLAYAVLAGSFLRTPVRLGIRRAFHLTFPDDVAVLDAVEGTARITARMQRVGEQRVAAAAR